MGLCYNAEIKYVLDKRSSTPTSEARSRIMRGNRSKNSKPEIKLRKALWHAGYRGYRLYPKRVTGKPDITFLSKKVAVFVHGCFWHRCPECNYMLPRTNSAYWKAKFERNLARDIENVQELESLGWIVVTIWECRIMADLPSAINKVIPHLH